MTVPERRFNSLFGSEKVEGAEKQDSHPCQSTHAAWSCPSPAGRRRKRSPVPEYCSSPMTQSFPSAPSLDRPTPMLTLLTLPTLEGRCGDVVCSLGLSSWNIPTSLSHIISLLFKRISTVLPNCCETSQTAFQPLPQHARHSPYSSLDVLVANGLAPLWVIHCHRMLWDNTLLPRPAALTLPFSMWMCDVFRCVDVDVM